MPSILTNYQLKAYIYFLDHRSPIEYCHRLSLHSRIITMSHVTLKNACQLTGKSKRTIQRYMSSGKLSYTTNRQGHKQIDTSELIRVFGELSPSVTSKVRPDVTVTNDTTILTPELAQLIAAEVSKGVALAIEPLIKRIEELTHILEHKNAANVDKNTQKIVEPVKTDQLKKHDYFSGLSFLGKD